MKSYGPGGPRGPPLQIPRSTHSRGVPRQSSRGAPFLILKPSIEVTIMLTQPEFPANRRRDPCAWPSSRRTKNSPIATAPVACSTR